MLCSVFRAGIWRTVNICLVSLVKISFDLILFNFVYDFLLENTGMYL